MANKDSYEGRTERIIIVNGPTFGQGLRWITFGALLGAGAAYYVLGGIKRKSLAALAKEKAASKARETAGRAGRRASETAGQVLEDVESRVEAAGETVEEKLQDLASRARDLGDKASNTVDAAREFVGPTLKRAIAEGKKMAAQTRARLKEDVDEAGDKPYLAELDGDLPSQQEDKFVE